MNILIYFCLVLFSFFAFESKAAVFIDPLFVYRPPAKTLDRRGIQAELLFNRLISNSNYAHDGRKENMLANEIFEKTEGELKLRFGLSDDFEVTAGVRYRDNYAIDLVVEQNNTTYNLKKAGAESALLFVKYNLYRGPKWVFTSEAKIRRSLYSNPQYRSSNPYAFIVLGDEGTEFSLGGHLSYTSVKKVNLSGSLFLNIPNSTLSEELVYDVQLGLPITRLALVAGVNGVLSLLRDPYREIPNQKPPIGTANTLLFNSINRAWVSPYVGFQFALHPRWRVDLMGRHIASGTSTAQGQEFYLQLVWGEPGISKKDVKVESFKDYSLEANVIKVSPRGKFVRIDKGITQDIDKGVRMDIYQTDYFGGNNLLASGIVYESYAETAIIKIDQVYREDISIKEGHIARGSLR